MTSNTTTINEETIEILKNNQKIKFGIMSVFSEYDDIDLDELYSGKTKKQGWLKSKLNKRRAKKKLKKFLKEVQSKEQFRNIQRLVVAVANEENPNVRTPKNGSYKSIAQIIGRKKSSSIHDEQNTDKSEIECIQITQDSVKINDSIKSNRDPLKCQKKKRELSDTEIEIQKIQKL